MIYVNLLKGSEGAAQIRQRSSQAQKEKKIGCWVCWFFAFFLFLNALVRIFDSLNRHPSPIKISKSDGWTLYSAVKNSNCIEPRGTFHSNQRMPGSQA